MREEKGVEDSSPILFVSFVLFRAPSGQYLRFSPVPYGQGHEFFGAVHPS
jgi:hypothetical protein